MIAYYHDEKKNFCGDKGREDRRIYCRIVRSRCGVVVVMY
jgi:hypothetical protein